MDCKAFGLGFYPKFFICQIYLIKSSNFFTQKAICLGLNDL